MARGASDLSKKKRLTTEGAEKNQTQTMQLDLSLFAPYVSSVVPVLVGRLRAASTTGELPRGARGARGNMRKSMNHAQDTEKAPLRPDHCCLFFLRSPRVPRAPRGSPPFLHSVSSVVVSLGLIRLWGCRALRRTGTAPEVPEIQDQGNGGQSERGAVGEEDGVALGVDDES